MAARIPFQSRSSDSISHGNSRRSTVASYSKFQYAQVVCFNPTPAADPKILIAVTKKSQPSKHHSNQPSNSYTNAIQE
ncbi:hypothetical protein ACLOJK_015101, partial [Asimina triloba]